MSLQDLKEEVAKLPTNERLALISWIAESIKDSPQESGWQFLESRSDTWRNQLYMKGRKLPASIVWSDIIANEMTIDQAVENWDLSAIAIQEAIQYCESHRELIAYEAEVDREETFVEKTSLSPVVTKTPPTTRERNATSSNRGVLS